MGEKSLLCDPGSELQLAGRAKRRANIINTSKYDEKKKKRSAAASALLCCFIAVVAAACCCCSSSCAG